MIILRLLDNLNKKLLDCCTTINEKDTARFKRELKTLMFSKYL